MNTRFLARVALIAAAFWAIAAIPATAAEECKDPVTAEGLPAAMRDLGAYPNSLLAWRAAVRDKYGSEYNSWRYAQDRNVDCEEDDGQWVCKRKARPCKDVLHRIIDGTIMKANCKDESLSAYGAGRRSERSAMEEAVSGWEIDARKEHGSKWGEWDNAADTDVDCHNIGGGHQCIAVGTPCKAR